jgi:hypothetical protein
MQAQAVVIIEGKCEYLGDNLHVTLGVAGGVALLLLHFRTAVVKTFLPILPLRSKKTPLLSSSEVLGK